MAHWIFASHSTYDFRTSAFVASVSAAVASLYTRPVIRRQCCLRRLRTTTLAQEALHIASVGRVTAERAKRVWRECHRSVGTSAITIKQLSAISRWLEDARYEP